jgi:glutathione synthase
MRFVFLMDPLERINIHGDSTFVLMLESQSRGHEVYFAEPKDLELRENRAHVEARRAEVRRKVGDHSTAGNPEWLDLDTCDAVFSRKDPPFDVDYLISTFILDHVDRRRVVCVNDSQGIRDFNEKLSALRFPELMSKTIVTANLKRLRAFIEEVGVAVVKPLTLAGGSGVIQLKKGDRNIGSVLDLLTREGRAAIEAQAYIDAVVEGDKRIILLDGKPIGAINRRPRADDLRANMHVGGTAEKAMLTPREEQICARIGPELSRRGLVFVGIDVIGGYLTEINVTSPTGLQEIARFDGTKPEATIIDWVEKKRVMLADAWPSSTSSARS